MAACLHKARNYVIESTGADQICKNGPESGQIKCRKTKTWHLKPRRHEYSSYKFHSQICVEESWEACKEMRIEELEK